MNERKRSAGDLSSAAAGRDLQNSRHRPFLGYSDAAELLLQLSCPSKQIASTGRFPDSEKSERYYEGNFVNASFRGSSRSTKTCSMAVDNERNESTNSHDNKNSAARCSARQGLDDVRQGVASTSSLKDDRSESTNRSTVPRGASGNMARQTMSPLAIPPELPNMRQRGLSIALRDSSETKDKSATPTISSRIMTQRNMSPLAAPPQLPNVKFGSIVKKNHP
jgi:hypothetical protein